MMDDLISRQAVIDKFEPWLKVEGYSEGELNMLKAVLYELRFIPSIQPLQLTDDDKETIRIHLSAFKERLCNQRRWNEANEYEELIARFLMASSVQPRKGKWIGKERFANSQEYFSWECDKCEWVLEDPTLDKPYSFCPNCGADMRGEQDT